MKKLLFLSAIFSVVCSTLTAQNVSGIWRGYFISHDGSQYKLEVQIGTKGRYFLEGVTYSYLSTVFYGKATATGNYNSASKKLQIAEIKTVELRMSGGSVACIMKYFLDYSRSGNEEFLEGAFTSKYEKSDKTFGIKRGENCGGGRVFLRRVQTSDFYVEPFVRTKPAERKPDVATTKKPPVSSNTTKPPVTQKPATKPPQNNTTAKAPAPKTTTPTRTDTVKRITTPPFAKQEPTITLPKVEIKIPQVTRSRENDLVQTLVIHNEDIVVRLYDNGEIDDDTISVFLDNKLILSNKRLSAQPITLNLKVDESNPEHTLVMVAENLGRIPPNTSLMIVQDGEKRYQVSITSTMQKNAMVRFRYQKKSD
ncbi:MAG: hypothetical protein ICV84_09815 [Flavisolibacter sp.]|nr:hypothetical protein [Flavisolibacter sp.]